MQIMHIYIINSLCRTLCVLSIPSTYPRPCVTYPDACPTGPQLWEYQLEELALYFLLYTEAANLRHLPEGLWFLFWIFRNSAARMAEVGRV